MKSQKTILLEQKRLARLRDLIQSQLEDLGDEIEEAEIIELLGPYLNEKDRIEAEIQGGGAIASGDHSIAIGDGGVFIQQNITMSESSDPLTAIAKYKQVIYSQSVRKSFHWIRLGFERKDWDERLGSKLYVPLLTKSLIKPPGVENLDRGAMVTYQRLSAIDAVMDHRYVAILGDPGSGKSTFLRHILMNLVAPEDEDRTLSPWVSQLKDFLPIYISLKDFAQSIHSRQTEEPAPQMLWDFIKADLKAGNLGSAIQAIHAQLEEGKCILLCDGLDEITSPHGQAFVRDAILAFVNRYKDNRYIITCRTLVYQPVDETGDVDVRFPAWDRYELAPFDEDQIQGLIETWAELIPVDGANPAAARDQTLRKMKRALQDKKLEAMASNPLTLTLILLIRSDLHSLSEGIAPLYERVITFLIQGWESSKTKIARRTYLERLLHKAGKDLDDLEDCLAVLAFGAQKDGFKKGAKSGLGDIPEYRIIKAFAKLNHNDLNWGAQVCDILRLRTGILQERRPEIYTFPHLSFQSYLAGAHLSKQKNFIQLVQELILENAHWQDVILFAISRMVYVMGDLDRPLVLVNELCPVQTTIRELDENLSRVRLAGAILVEMGASSYRENRRLGQDSFTHTQQLVTGLFNKVELAPQERDSFGKLLADLGDPRFNPGFYYLPAEPQLGLVEIPAGEFLMGSDLAVDVLAYPRECPQHTLYLPRYYISKYAVTIAQFEAFLNATGYRPRYPHLQSGPANHPVVNLTWHDALAYCSWLNSKLLESESTPALLKKLILEDGYTITLPSEAEWEKAARGVDGRIFPWGNQFMSNRGNFAGTNIEKTCAVGSFPDGASPYGLLDMSGNCWEWTRSLWGDAWDSPSLGYPYDPGDGREDLAAPDQSLRVMRGSGAYQYQEKFLRCAYKSRFCANDTELNYSGFGLRIVLARLGEHD